MKKVFLALFVFASLLLIAGNPQYCAWRIVDADTGLDIPDVSNVTFQVELVSGSGDIQSNTGVHYEDIGAGTPNSYIDFDLGNFTTDWTPAMDIEITVWNGGEPSTVEVQNCGDIQTAPYAFFGWEFYGADDLPISVPAAPTNPNAASNPTPADAAGDVAIDANLSWEYSGSVTPDGYKLYMGTENPPTVEYDLGNVLTYDPGVDFNYETTYYWQIVPYTTDAKTAGRDSGRTLREARPVATGAVRGDAADCPIWSFTTVETPGTGTGTTTGTGATPTPIPIEPITLPAGTIAGNANVTPPAGNNGGAGYTIDFEIQQTPANGGLQNPDNVAFTYVISIGGAQVGDTFTFELPYVGAPSSELVWFDGVSWAPVTAPQWDVPGAGFVTFQITITTVGRDGSIEVAFNDGESALPVTLTYFAATLAQQTTANIQWTVESESGIIGYYVLRSETDFASAQGISELVRAENTPFSHSYSFIDDELEYEHTYYYWLESVNADGTNTVWGPQDIMLQGAPAPQLPQVTMLHGNYPNPFNPSTVLKLTVKETETAHLAIFNAKGQEVLSKSFEAGYHEFEWNAEGEASGLYFYKLSSPSYSQVHKMMLLK